MWPSKEGIGWMFGACIVLLTVAVTIYLMRVDVERVRLQSKCIVEMNMTTDWCWHWARLQEGTLIMNPDKLRKLAEAADSEGGAWWSKSTIMESMFGLVNDVALKRDASFIAAVSPEMVLALLDRLDRLDRDCDTCANKSTDGIYSEDCLMCRHYFGDAYEPRPEKNKCAPSQD
jgi:hypothetical protein